MVVSDRGRELERLLARRPGGRDGDVESLLEAMSRSPLSFFRGALPLMARDLARRPRTGLTVQACGEADLSNFAPYSSHEGHVVLDLCDFDETFCAPWEWDVKRLAVSAVLVGRNVGLPDARSAELAASAVRGYRRSVRDLSRLSVLDLWQHRVEAHDLLTELGGHRRRETGKAGASRRPSVPPGRADPGAARLRVVTEQGAHRISEQPPVLQRKDPAQLRRPLERVMASYRNGLAADRRRLLDRFQVEDALSEQVVTGAAARTSVVVLMLDAGGYPLFLRLREATTSALDPDWQREPVRSQGLRVTEGRALIQGSADPFLGHASDEGIDFSVSLVRQSKSTVDLEGSTASALSALAARCGQVLARAHARSGDAAAIAGYLGSSDRVDRAIVSFAESYAEQTERDHRAYVAAVGAGRLR
jgi:Uncharacterized protein conserved in bacteria (DUF2252)